MHRKKSQLVWQTFVLGQRTFNKQHTTQSTMLNYCTLFFIHRWHPALYSFGYKHCAAQEVVKETIAYINNYKCLDHTIQMLAKGRGK
jgi:hypothetical protein